MPSFGATSSGRLGTCDGRLQRLMREVVKHFDCSIICGHRGPEEQKAAFDAGNSKAQFGQSPHNPYPAKAVDALPYPVDWADKERMCYFAGFVMAIALEMEIPLRWGNDWDRDTDLNDNSLKDYPHFELTDWRE